MPEPTLPSDDTARRQSLDVAHSYMVQAPAGSGKTELLTQRFLALLAKVKNPEEVWAITFTRKAAAEMRSRILNALNDAMGPEPQFAHERRTWRLAEEVVRKDQELGWDLMVNPSRLQVFTIDSLCASLVRQMPVLSGFGMVPNITNFAERLYVLAARRTLQSINQGGQIASHVSNLLRHLNNDDERAETLLSSMLESRDRWLSHVVEDNHMTLSREVLEDNLNEIVASQLQKTHDLLPFDLIDEILDTSAFAAKHVRDESSPLKHCAHLDALPDPLFNSRANALPIWRGLRYLLLTDKNQVRKQATIRIGFPTEKSGSDADERKLFAAMKKRVSNLFAQLDDHPEFVRELGHVELLPETGYTDDQWQIFVALKALLKLAVAHLKVLFQETGEVDYTEVAHRALSAIGGAESPTELALQLDYRLKHLLVDEFQDTSRSQYELIRGLIEGWQIGDGRTLFLVGDPMQSIYRFRDANVGLFLRVRDYGIGNIKPHFIRLTDNFRSSPELVDWCNRMFAQAFPDQDSIENGAVKFSPAQAALKSQSPEDGVKLHSIVIPSQHIEGELVASLVADYLKKTPEISIAVLVRSRNHLDEILPALRSARIRYRALDLESLSDQPVVRDLFALTRALLHLGDRTAWLTVLRAPWCGLTLDDLYALAGHNTDLTIWELIINESRRGRLSNDGQIRLNRIKRVLARSLAERGRRGLSRWVEGTWAAMAGPACIFNRAEQRDATAFFELLEQADADGYHDDIDYLSSLIAKLKAADDKEADPNVQVMTIHRAKGLEFDVVIVPGTERFLKAHDATLLRSMEIAQTDDSRRLLIAPISPAGEQEPIHQYLASLDLVMTRHEDVRLLYVAATRARRALHLIGGLKASGKASYRPPASGSFLAYLWDGIEDIMLDDASFYQDDMVATMATRSLRTGQRPIYRVPSEWMLPSTPNPRPWKSQSALDHEVEELVEFSWAGDTARHIGIVVHRVLQQIAEQGVLQWQAQRLDTLDEYLKQMLQLNGVLHSQLDEAAARCRQAVDLTLQDERGRWILANHEDAQNELELSAWLDGVAQRVVLDRTFIADNYRWVIDYKTGSHEGGTVEAFLDRELERYQAQLERYARIVHRLKPLPIKLALYFPMLQAWREWDYRPV